MFAQNVTEYESRGLLIPDSYSKPILLTNASNYADLFMGSRLVADNSYFLMELCQMSALVRITLPRKMGKTILLTMIKSFCELPGGVRYGPAKKKLKQSPNYKLFKDTLIFEDAEFVKEFFGAFPTVYLTLRNVSGENFEKFLRSFAYAIQRVYEEFSYLLGCQNKKDEVKRLDKKFIKKVLKSSNELTKVELQFSILTLTEMLHLYHDANVYVLIDDYDWPINKMNLLEKVEREKIVDFCESFLSTTFKTNTHLKQGIVAGNIRFCSGKYYSPLTYEECNLMRTNRISRYFGFSESLADDLAKKIEQLCQMQFEKEHLKMAKEWYKGFSFCEDELFYNPYSMSRFFCEYPFLRKGALQCYSTVTINIEEHALKRTEIANNIQLIIDYTNGDSKEKARFDLIEQFTTKKYQNLQKFCLENYAITKESIDLILSFLCHLGYIALNGGSPIIPNIEQRMFLEQQIKHYVSSK